MPNFILSKKTNLFKDRSVIWRKTQTSTSTGIWGLLVKLLTNYTKRIQKEQGSNQSVGDSVLWVIALIGSVHRLNKTCFHCGLHLYLVVIRGCSSHHNRSLFISGVVSRVPVERERERERPPIEYRCQSGSETPICADVFHFSVSLSDALSTLSTPALYLPECSPVTTHSCCDYHANVVH